MATKRKRKGKAPKPPADMRRMSYGKGYGPGYCLNGPIWFEPYEIISWNVHEIALYHHASLILRAIQWGAGGVKFDDGWLRRILPEEVASDIPAFLDDLLRSPEWDIVDDRLVHLPTQARRREIIDKLEARKAGPKRRGISKKLRFEILKKSRFACAYCGAKAPDVELVVDHVDPVARGGADEPANMVAACFDCNAGKGDRPIEGGV